jgi:hypothetical protein
MYELVAWGREKRGGGNQRNLFLIKETEREVETQPLNSPTHRISVVHDPCNLFPFSYGVTFARTLDLQIHWFSIPQLNTLKASHLDVPPLQVIELRVCVERSGKKWRGGEKLREIERN